MVRNNVIARASSEQIDRSEAEEETGSKAFVTTAATANFNN
jgi:hypothetical protein